MPVPHADLRDKCCGISKFMFRTFCEHAIQIQREDIEGLKEKGSYVYAAYDSDGELLYVGQTSESIQRRFHGDGSGAHKHKKWYKRVSMVKYLELSNVPEAGDGELGSEDHYRKIVERCLIFAGKPRHNKQ